MSDSKSIENSTRTPWSATAPNQTVTHICEQRKSKAPTSFSAPNAKLGSVSIVKMNGTVMKLHVSK